MKWTCLTITGMVLAGAAVSGCVAEPDVPYGIAMSRGEFGEARMIAIDHMSTDRSDRRYMLDRLKLGIAALADGFPQAAERPLEEVYRILRTQGINKDAGAAAVVLNEDLKTWKGEPFEQAMAFYYVGLYHAMLGDWGNARAAAGNALFQLRDFGADRYGRRLDSEDLIRESMDDESYLDHGYVETDTDFALGYLLNAVANQNLGREAEAADNFRKAVQIDAGLEELVSLLQLGDFNTLLVVELGPGPQKVGTGPDNAIASFRPLVRSDSRPLTVRVGGAAVDVPVVCDVNHMAADHMWNNLEDVRLAKSTIGSLLVAGGTVTSIYGLDDNSEAAAYAGLGMLVAGLFLKAGAHADTRYCEGLPQRVYIAPITVADPASTIELNVAGINAARMVLVGLGPPPPGQVQLRYVRMVSPAQRPPAWATSGNMVHANDAGDWNAVPEEHAGIPYILGGNCVREPRGRVLADLRAGDLFADKSTMRLAELYRLEGIEIASATPGSEPGLHVLEGGTWLYTPLAGTAGFARLFCQNHRPYRPRSPEVQALAARVEQAVGARGAVQP